MKINCQRQTRSFHCSCRWVAAELHSECRVPYDAEVIRCHKWNAIVNNKP